MQLVIDTTQRDRIVFVLFEGKQEIVRVERKVKRQSERLLPELEKFLQQNEIQLDEIEKVSTDPGPGPFTSVRAGAAVANALNFALGNGAEMMLPKYDKPPNITQPKQHG